MSNDARSLQSAMSDEKSDKESIHTVDTVKSKHRFRNKFKVKNIFISNINSF